MKVAGRSDAATTDASSVTAMAEGGDRSARRGKPAALYFGGILVSIVVLVAFLSLLWTPYDPESIDVAQRLYPPATDGYLLGTDRLGRDVLSQIMAGARVSLFVSALATSAAVLPGVTLGLIAASVGRVWRVVLGRVIDLGVAFPGILVALVLVTAMRPGRLATITALTIWFVPLVARFTIGPARQILAQEYVEAARACGRSRAFILVRHVFPNITPILIVLASTLFASAILIEAALSYLGLGVPRPAPSWGRLLQEGQGLVAEMPTLVIYPGIAIVIAVLGFNLLGDGLRAVTDPQRTTRDTLNRDST